MTTLLRITCFESTLARFFAQESLRVIVRFNTIRSGELSLSRQKYPTRSNW
jgi:hypothetical protein